jgi:hypothetical protein
MTDPTLTARLPGFVLGVVVVVFLFMAFGFRSSVAHETIDTQRTNALLAAADEALAHAESAAMSGPKGEARFALGLVLAEAADILNRDLAAHGGRLAFNAEHLLKALAQRDLAPRFDEVIGRYRTPRASLEEALRLSPKAPYALRARFELLKAAFYESFDINPLALVGVGFDELERQIAESKALASALSSPEDAGEAAFIQAVDLARAARLAPSEAVRAQYRRRADAALKNFAEHYPGSLKAATADTLRRMIAEDGG